MKKTIKVIIIVVLVLLVIGGTVFLFLKRDRENNITTSSIERYLSSTTKVEQIDKGLVSVASIVNSDGTDNRMNLINNTNNKLNEIIRTLITYYVKDNTQITNEKIYKKFAEVQGQQSLLLSMLNEYNIKKDSSFFNRHIGANDLYIQSCNYLYNYAELAQLINDSVKVNKVSDAKFNMFELYTIIAKQTFNKENIEEISGRKTLLKEYDDLTLMNSVVKLKNGNLVKIENEGTAFENVTILLSINNNNFNKHYQKCNKEVFANNLASNVQTVNTASQSTDEKLATYYFKLIYGI